MKADELPPVKWSAPDSEGLLQFLVQEKEFNEDRVRKGIDRINAAKGKASQVGGRRRVRGSVHGHAAWGGGSTQLLRRRVCAPVAGRGAPSTRALDHLHPSGAGPPGELFRAGQGGVVDDRKGRSRQGSRRQAQGRAVGGKAQPKKGKLGGMGKKK